MNFFLASPSTPSGDALWQGEEGALQGVRLHSPREIKLPSRKTAAKNVIGDRFNRWLQQPRWAIALHLPRSCCSCDDNHQSGWPTGQQPPLLHSGVECVQTGAALKGVTATTQDGCENVWKKKNPLQESVGASVHVCIQVCERQQEGFTTQILSCAVMFHFVIRK